MGSILDYLRKYTQPAATTATANAERGVADSLGTTSLHKFIADTAAGVSHLSDDMHAMKAMMDTMLAKLDEVRALLNSDISMRVVATSQPEASISTMSRGKPVSVSATAKFTYKGVAITSAYKVVAVMICTIIDICVELHRGDMRSLSLSTLDIWYLGPIVRLVMDRMPPNMKDSLAFSNDSMGSVKLSLCTTQSAGTMVVSEATFVNARASESD